MAARQTNPSAGLVHLDGKHAERLIFCQNFRENLLTCPDKCNIISQCDVVRKYLAKSPGMAVLRMFTARKNEGISDFRTCLNMKKRRNF